MRYRYGACCAACRTTLISNVSAGELRRSLAAHHKTCGKPRTWTRGERPYSACCVRCRTVYSAKRGAGLADQLRRHACDGQLRKQRMHRERAHRRKAAYRRYEHSHDGEYVTASCVACHKTFRSLNGDRVLRSSLRQHRTHCRGTVVSVAPRAIPPGEALYQARYPQWDDQARLDRMTDAIAERILGDMARLSVTHQFGVCSCAVCRAIKAEQDA